jgi:predicted TPR repeat methyltransferase
MEGNFEQARAFFLEGVAHYQGGRYAEAERSFTASLALVPGRPSTLTNLGAARLKLGRAADALAVLQEATAREPDNAEALGHCGTALAELGRHVEALQAFDRALAVDPARGVAWTLRGSVLRDLGRLEDAAESFRHALARGADPELNRYYLASLQGGDVPPAPPREYVEALFDGYAGQFDEQLVRLLNYRVPERLAARLAGRQFERALDLGCGTGLCAPLLAPLAGAIDGVDLSHNMLAQARAGGRYEQLQQGDLLDFLRQAGRRYDLVIAADVFIYVGALDDVFAAVAGVMPMGGVFCFSVEESVQELELRPSLRYAHSEKSLRRLAADHGFDWLALERGPVREEQRQPIAGLFAWLVRQDTPQR